MNILKSIQITSLCGLISLQGANAAEIVFENKTGAEVRIEEVRNKCNGYIISKKNQAVLQDGDVLLILDTPPVVHTYLICGSGFCSSSAIGMKKDEVYKVNIVLDGPYISGKVTPDLWPGNINCPTKKQGATNGK